MPLSLSQGVSPDFDWLNHVTPERFTGPAGLTGVGSGTILRSAASPGHAC
jgi:hypothetical protein